MNRKWWVAPFIIALIVIVTAVGWRAYYASRDERQQPFVVAVGTWVGFGKAIIAKEAGYFDKSGVEITIIDDPNALLGGLVSGQIDVAQNSIDQFALLRSRGVQASLLMVTDESAGGDGIVGARGLDSVSDLAGRTVAFTRGPASEYLLATALRRSRIPIGNVKLLGFDDPGATLSAYVSGNADAIVIWQPFLNQALERSGSRMLATSRDYPNTILGVLLLNDRSSDKTEQLDAFLEGWQKAEWLLETDPKRAKALMAKGFGVPIAEIEGWLSGDKLKSRADNAAYLSNDGRALEALVASADAYWRERGLAGPMKPSTKVAAPHALGYYAR